MNCRNQTAEPEKLQTNFTRQVRNAPTQRGQSREEQVLLEFSGYDVPRTADRAL
jgi:hypothetical protein